MLPVLITTAAANPKPPFSAAAITRNIVLRVFTTATIFPAIVRGKALASAVLTVYRNHETTATSRANLVAA